MGEIRHDHTRQLFKTANHLATVAELVVVPDIEHAVLAVHVMVAWASTMPGEAITHEITGHHFGRIHVVDLVLEITFEGGRPQAAIQLFDIRGRGRDGGSGSPGKRSGVGTRTALPVSRTGSNSGNAFGDGLGGSGLGQTTMLSVAARPRRSFL